MENLFEVNNLHKTFSNKDNNVNALKGVSLEILNGETLGIQGISGSGKSTFLHILGTLDKPTEGEVLFDGIDVFKYDDEKLSQIRNTKIGFVFQFHYLLSEFNALENVMIPCLINGIDKKNAEEMATDILGRVGLKDRLSHKPGELSGGEQQRVAIARAVVLTPRVVLADEPTGNLDLKTGMDILDLFLELNHEKNITCVIITHNTDLANKLNRTVTLSDGTIVNVN
ncbi:MAG: ABC transporter ATP-binding protein [Thermodesulfobacteriota bacterium]